MRSYWSRTTLVAALALLTGLVGGGGRAAADPPPRIEVSAVALPPHALLRFGASRLRHADVVSCVAFAAGGKALASGSWDRTVRLWEVATGKELRRFVGHQDAVYSLAITADNRTLLSSGRDGTVRQWDVDSGRERRLLARQDEPVYAVAIAGDGRTAAWAGGDGFVRLWDLTKSRPLRALTEYRDEELRRLKAYQKDVLALAFAPDSHLLAWGGAGNQVVLWDVTRGAEARRIEGAGVGIVHTVAFSPDGRLIAIGSHEGRGGGPQVGLWEVRTGKRLHLFPLTQIALDQVAFSPSGNTLMAVWPSTIRRWDLATGKPLPAFETQPGGITSLTFSRDGKMLATGGYMHTIWFQDAVTGKQLDPITASHQLVRDAAHVPGQPLLVTRREDGMLALHDRRSGKELRRLGEHSGLNARLAFTSGGSALVTGAHWDSSEVVLRETASGKLLQRFRRPEQGALALAITPRDRTLVAGLDGHRVGVWDLATAKRLFRVDTSTHGGVWRIALSPDGRLLAVLTGDWSLQLWDLRVGRPLSVIPTRHVDAEGHHRASPHVAFSVDGRTIATGGDDGVVCLWEAATGGARGRFQVTPESLVGALAFASNGRWLAAGERDYMGGEGVGADAPPKFGPARRSLRHAIHVWDVVTRKRLHRFEAGESDVIRLDFAPDLRTLVSVQADGTAFVWEVARPSPRPPP
jgi:WD40 repeat protein